MSDGTDGVETLQWSESHQAFGSFVYNSEVIYAIKICVFYRRARIGNGSMNSVKIRTRLNIQGIFFVSYYWFGDLPGSTYFANYMGDALT